MAIPSYLSNVLDKDTNTFGDWFERTKTISNDIGTKVLTAETTSSGGTTTGNTSLVGIFSANTVAVGTSLRGGTIETPATLNIVSNTAVTAASSAFTNTSHTITSNTYVLSSNTITSTSNTLSYTSDVITFSTTGDITFAAANVDIVAANMNVTGNTAFSTGSATFNTITIGSTIEMETSSSISGAFTVQDPVTFNSSVKIDSDDFLQLPSGTTGQRPGAPLTGMIRFNDSNSKFEGYNGSQWGNFGYEIPIQDETTNATRYIGFLDASSGITNTVFVSSTKLQFNPSTGSLSATDFNSLSDITFKQDMQPITNAADILERINTYSFEWKESGKKSYGVIAQELEQILPELINESEGTKYVNYTPLIAILLEGYKKLSEKVDQLEKS